MSAQLVEGRAQSDRESAAGARHFPLARASNPFPGLRAYGPTEAHLFFGREPHIEALLDKLTRQRFSAVIGVSGSGKSSLVLAGVLPRLMRGYRTPGRRDSGFLTARSAWRVARMRPGDDPIANLAGALHQASQSEDAPESDTLEASLAGAAAHVDSSDVASDAGLELALLEGQLRRSQQGLVEAGRSLRLAPHENLLVIVDQFEELFRFRELSRTPGQIHDPALAFVKLLLRATQQQGTPIYVMLTMRSDFLGDCVQFSGLPEAINSGQYLLPLLDRDQREQVIRGPMGVVAAPIAPALVQRLLNDAGDMTDQLPVLQHALMRSFELWQQDSTPDAQLENRHYERAGGMQAALSQHAEEALAEVEAELGAEGLRVTEKLFRALTERGPHGRGVRRPCRASEVLAVADTDLDTLRKVVQRFAGERGFLIVQPGLARARDRARELSPDSSIDICHEALMRVWQRLQHWSAAEVAFANQLATLHEAQQNWQHGRAGLWRDPELALALSWLERERPSPRAVARYAIDLTQIEAFLAASREAQAQARAVELDAKTLRRFRRMFSEAKTTTLVSLLSLLVLLLLQGSGVLDQLWPRSTRLNFLSVSSRNVLELGLHEDLRAVVLDATSVARLANEQRGPAREPVGAGAGAEWRVLHAELLRRLADAGARSVVFDLYFPTHARPTPLVRSGSEALAQAIQYARSKGTAVVIAADVDTEAQIRHALSSTPADASYASGTEANAVLRIAKVGAAVFLPLLIQRQGQSSLSGLALAAAAGFWHTPNLFLDAADRTVFLNGRGVRDREVAFAGMGRPFEQDFDVLKQGDRPAQQIIDITPGDEAKRGAAGVSAYEDVLLGSDLAAFRGRLVLVGTQLPDEDVHELKQCGLAPWSCRTVARWGMNVQLDAMSNLLRGHANRPIAPLAQLFLMLALCACSAWLRMRNRDKTRWRQRAALLGLMIADLALVAGAAIFFSLLMDEVYQLLAMLGTHVIVGRLDKH
jgi:CHASE2 domain-containing sensor protein